MLVFQDELILRSFDKRNWWTILWCLSIWAVSSLTGRSVGLGSCQDRWWEMWRSISEIFSFRYSGLKQVLFYSFYNTWSMIGSPPATLAVQWVSAGERDRQHFLLFMVVLWLLWPHAKVSFSPDRTLVYRKLY